MFTKEELIDIFDSISEYTSYNMLMEKIKKHAELGNHYILSIIAESKTAKTLNASYTANYYLKRIPTNDTNTINKKFKSNVPSNEPIAKELRRLSEKDMFILIYWSIYRKNANPKWIDFLIKLQGNEIKPFIERNPDIIEAAARFDMKNVIKYFISKGIDITLSPYGYGSDLALLAAAQKSNVEMMKLLIGAGAKPNKAHAHWAILSENLDAIKLIIDNGVRFNDEFFNHTFRKIIDKANIKVAKIMLDNGMDPRADGYYAFNRCYRKSKRGKGKEKFAQLYTVLEEYLEKTIILENKQKISEDNTKMKTL